MRRKMMKMKMADEDDDNTLSSLSVIYKPNIHTVNDDEMLMTVRMR
jgi:hypothetical protein